MAPSFYPAQEEEAVHLVWNMLQTNTPKLWDSELQRAAASVVLSMIYNLPVLKSSDDPAIDRINQFVSRVARAMFPGTYLVEYLPFMRYFPAFISKWKRDSQMWYRRDTELFRSLYIGVKNRMEKGDDSRGSFTSHIIRDQERHDLSETEISWLSATIYTGGAETSATAMSWFMLAMMAYPEVQKKCQAELDTVVGHLRMPRHGDRDDLPFIQATVREVHRWRTVLPIVTTSGAPHQSTEDDWYGGYYIPKNTIVISNIWAMYHDTDVYGPDVHVFKPERHLGPDGKLALFPSEAKRNVSFGYGGRICPGRHVANSFLFINIASILWAANIAPEKDALGKYIPPDISETATVNDGVVVRPLPFKCSITPRFPEALEVVARARQELDK